MLVLYFLMLVLAADVESEQITSALEEIKNDLSAVNLRLARIEEQQKTTESMYSRHEEKINCLDKEQSESILWQKYTVSLINEHKVNDEGLEAQQKTMTSQLNQLVDNTDRCCQENITVTCESPSSTSLLTTQPPTTTTTQPSTTTPALQDCKAVKDGVYQLKVGTEQIPVYCADGFVTFQRRYNGQLNFDKTFTDYEQGFGIVSSEHWMGLRYLHEMTKDKSCTFRARIAVDNTQHNKKLCETKYTADCDGQIKEILARDFRVLSAAEKYEIHIVLNQTDFIHPSVLNGLKQLNGLKFSTKDQDNDQHASSNCAALDWMVNGGFWYEHCLPGYPNSVVSSDKSLCSNSVCGNWWPYYFTSSLLQFSC